MISLNNLSIQFGGEYLFKDISLRIGDRDRIAIVGSNGAGKSTLMKIVVGLIEPDSGSITRSRSTTVGYLPQDGVHNVGKTLFEEAATAFNDLLQLHDRVEDISNEISKRSAQGDSSSDELHALVDELGELQLHLEHKEAYNIETRVKQVLSGLGFHEKDFPRITDEFSGGWQMRIELAKLLLREPTILLLDEPTNHLDIDSLEWLEEYLRSYEGSVVVVSHDSRFLDNMVTKTIEISLAKMTSYAGNYSFYLEQKEERTAQLEAEYENQQQQIKQTKKFIERFRYKATKARQVQSRIKALEKIDLIELEDQEDSIHFDFPAPPQSGRIAMELRDISKAYDRLHLYEHLDLAIERGDKIAFLGANGAGKSTLARIIAGIEPINDGERKPGHNAIISYYAQHQAEELDPRKTVLETLDDIAAGDVRKRLRTLLGCFLFSGDDVLKQVRVLSGGERSRLALAKMLLTPANLLVLDEPTNHLDLRSKAVLQEALGNFEGTYIIVSHDRDFIEPIVNKVVDFTTEASTGLTNLRVLIGTVSDYLRKRKEENLLSEKSRQTNIASAKSEISNTGITEKERKRMEAEARQERYKKLKPLKNALAKLEKEIAKTEGAKQKIESVFAQGDVYKDGEHLKQLNAEYKSATTQLAYLYDQWAKLEEEVELMEK